MGRCKVLDNCKNCGDELFDICFEKYGAFCVRDEVETDDLKYFEETCYCSNECYETYNNHFNIVMSCINSIIDEIDNESFVE